MNYQYKIPMLFATAFFTVLLFILAIFTPFKNRPSSTLSKSSLQAEVLQPVTINETAKENMFFATIFQNNLVIYNTDDMSKPYITSDISANTLTQADQIMLKNGIYLKNTQDISRLLEDYGS